eukprot:scpid43310/ scgid14390/ 
MHITVLTSTPLWQCVTRLTALNECLVSWRDISALEALLTFHNTQPSKHRVVCRLLESVSSKILYFIHWHWHWQRIPRTTQHFLIAVLCAQETAAPVFIDIGPSEIYTTPVNYTASSDFEPISGITRESVTILLHIHVHYFIALLNEIQSSFSSTCRALRCPRPVNTGLRKVARCQLDSRDW